MGQLVFQATLGGQVNLVGPNTASTLNINVPAFAGTMASLAAVTNNGVTYVNSSGQPTSGSAITFDGTNFATTGTASATKLIPTGSSVTGNGLYLPAANALGLSTNGTNAVYIDSSQRVGIGYTPSGSDGLFTVNVNSIGWYLGYGANYDNYYTAGTSGVQIFRNGNTERMRITSAGDVGIGTSSPAGSGVKLDVQNATYCAIRTLSTTNSVDTRLQSYDTNSVGYVGTISNHPFLLYTNNTERMRIDTSGRVLINKTSSDGGQLNVQNSSTTTRAYVNATLRNSRTASTHYSVVSWNGSLVADAWIGQVPSTDALCFGFDAGTTIAESMRLQTSGELLIGTTSQLGNSQVSVVSSQANQMLYLRNSNATPGGIFVNYSVATPNNTGSEFFFGNDPAQTRVTLRSNGGIANYSANNVNLSDRREKTNFAPAKSYLDVICAIPVQTFNYIDQNLEEDDGLTLGVVAQDVQAVAPELVSESDWSPEKDGSKMRLSIYQTDLQYALMKCIQEQQALIQQLQADIATLKGQK